MKEILNNTKAFSFLGVTSQQQFADLIAWELFFQKYRIDSLIELGTGHGGMSLYFLLMALQRSFRFFTVDTVVPNTMLNSRLGDRLMMEKYFDSFDIFSNTDKVLEHLGGGEAMLYCDNGDKPREVAVFGKYLRKYDFVAVHDWGIEISEKDILNNFKPILFAECEQLGSITRFFSVR